MKVTTTDATATTIGSVALAANEAGVIEATVVGFDSANGVEVTGKKIVAYKNVNGTITLGTATATLAVAADAAISGATFAFAAGTNAINIQVTGVAAHTIKWVAKATLTKVS